MIRPSFCMWVLRIKAMCLCVVLTCYAALGSHLFRQSWPWTCSNPPTSVFPPPYPPPPWLVWDSQIFTFNMILTMIAAGIRTSAVLAAGNEEQGGFCLKSQPGTWPTSSLSVGGWESKTHTSSSLEGVYVFFKFIFIFLNFRGSIKPST